jgi:hypothetical protein
LCSGSRAKSRPANPAGSAVPLPKAPKWVKRTIVSVEKSGLNSPYA